MPRHPAFRTKGHRTFAPDLTKGFIYMPERELHEWHDGAVHGALSVRSLRHRLGASNPTLSVSATGVGFWSTPRRSDDDVISVWRQTAEIVASIGYTYLSTPLAAVSIISGVSSRKRAQGIPTSLAVHDNVCRGSTGTWTGTSTATAPAARQTGTLVANPAFRDVCRNSCDSFSQLQQFGLGRPRRSLLFAAILLLVHMLLSSKLSLAISFSPKKKKTARLPTALFTCVPLDIPCIQAILRHILDTRQRQDRQTHRQNLQSQTISQSSPQHDHFSASAQFTPGSFSPLPQTPPPSGCPSAGLPSRLLPIASWSGGPELDHEARTQDTRGDAQHRVAARPRHGLGNGLLKAGQHLGQHGRVLEEMRRQQTRQMWKELSANHTVLGTTLTSRRTRLERSAFLRTHTFPKPPRRPRPAASWLPCLEALHTTTPEPGPASCVFRNWFFDGQGVASRTACDECATNGLMAPEDPSGRNLERARNGNVNSNPTTKPPTHTTTRVTFNERRPAVQGLLRPAGCTTSSPSCCEIVPRHLEQQETPPDCSSLLGPSPFAHPTVLCARRGPSAHNTSEGASSRGRTTNLCGVSMPRSA